MICAMETKDDTVHGAPRESHRHAESSADDAAPILVTDDRREGHDLISRTYTPWDGLPQVTGRALIEFSIIPIVHLSVHCSLND